MKTQIIILAAALILSLNTFASSSDKVSPDSIEIPVNLSTNNESEKALSIENWMHNDSVWTKTVSKTDMEYEIESDLSIESWMTNNDLWNKTSDQSNLYEEYTEGKRTYIISVTKVVKEDPLKIEAWMTNDRYWSL